MGRPVLLLRVSAALLTGLLYALALPPFSLWPLGWVCLVPLMLAVRGRPLWQAAVLGWLAGWSCAVLTGWWVWVGGHHFFGASTLASTVFILIVVGPACGLGMLIAAPLVEWAARANRPLPRAAAWPLAWLLGELLRTTGPLAMPWCLLGVTQVPVPLHLQTADLGGPLFVGALIAAVNACAAEMLARPGRRGRFAVTGAGVYAFVLVYGAFRLALIPDGPGGEVVPVVVVQGNIPQQERWEHERWPQHFAVHRRLTHRTRAEKAQVVIWPETAWAERGTDVPDYARTLTTLLLPGQTLITGFVERTAGPQNADVRRYNAALSVNGGGSVAVYRKRRLVPFGEYVPFELRRLDFLGMRRSFPRPLTPGPREPQMLVYHDHPRIGALICYEFLFPDTLARTVRAGARWLVVLSNDAWYDTTPAPVQHHSQLALAAVATRRWAVRATNTGITGGFDAWGRPLHFRAGETVQPGEPGTSNVVAEELPTPKPVMLPRREAAWGLLRIETRKTLTLFSRLGNWPGWGALAFWVLLALKRRAGTCAKSGSVAKPYLCKKSDRSEAES